MLDETVLAENWLVRASIIHAIVGWRGHGSEELYELNRGEQLTMVTSSQRRAANL
jgi:hypothetical protein